MFPNETNSYIDKNLNVTLSIFLRKVMTSKSLFSLNSLTGSPISMPEGNTTNLIKKKKKSTINYTVVTSIIFDGLLASFSVTWMTFVGL